jgi:hypothetical protein
MTMMLLWGGVGRLNVRCSMRSCRTILSVFFHSRSFATIFEDFLSAHNKEVNERERDFHQLHVRL